MARSLEGKVALITGARSPRGIGLAAGLKLAEAGADVVITSRFGPVEGSPLEFIGDERFATFKRFSDQVEAYGTRCLALPMDVTDRNQVDRVVETTVSELGGLDIVFNNAGTAFAETFVDTTAGQFQSAWDVNVLGTINVSQAAIPAMIRRQGGSIINNASIYGLGAAALVSAYVATKHAIVGLTKAMALELGVHHIRVNALCPGMVITEMGDLEYQMVADSEGTTFEEAKQLLADQNVLKRGAEASEIGDAVVYLAGEQSSFVSGIAMPIAAGQPVGL